MQSSPPPRTALLTLDTAYDDALSNRKLVGGATLLERQVDIALALGCQRILLFTAGQDDVAIKAQQLAEEAGAKFRLIQRGRQLLGAMAQQDELLVLAEGLLLTDREAISVLEGGPVLCRGWRDDCAGAGAGAAR